MDDQTYNRLYSTDEIWFAQQTNRGLTEVIDEIFNVTDNLSGNYAAKNHTHSKYALKDHNHDDSYYKKSEVDDMIANLKSELIQMIDDAIAKKDNSTSDTEDSATEDTSDTVDNTESSSE